MAAMVSCSPHSTQAHCKQCAKCESPQCNNVHLLMNNTHCVNDLLCAADKLLAKVGQGAAYCAKRLACTATAAAGAGAFCV